MRSITPKQQQVYDYIVSFSQEHGYPPSIREICAAVGLKSPSSVHAHIRTLCDLGYITKDDRKTRALTAAGSSTSGKVPIIGRVTAGKPILAVEEIEGYIPFEPERGSSDEYFALTIQGDSMTGAGILDGDYVIVRRQQTAMTGEIIVALIEDQATVKRLAIKGQDVWLMPENPDYQPIYAPGCNVLGVVKAVFRRY